MGSGRDNLRRPSPCSSPHSAHLCAKRSHTRRRSAPPFTSHSGGGMSSCDPDDWQTNLIKTPSSPSALLTLLYSDRERRASLWWEHAWMIGFSWRHGVWPQLWHRAAPTDSAWGTDRRRSFMDLHQQISQKRYNIERRSHLRMNAVTLLHTTAICETSLIQVAANILRQHPCGPWNRIKQQSLYYCPDLMIMVNVALPRAHPLNLERMELSTRTQEAGTCLTSIRMI